MTFIWPWMLSTLLLIPLLMGLYLWLLRNRQRSVVALSALGMAQNHAGRGLGSRRHIPLIVFLLGLTLLLVGSARPQMNVSLPRMEGTVILAFDVSSSMMAADLEPTRIDAARAAARAFVENQPGTISIGVVAFSNGGLIVQAPTNDQGAILAAIDRLSLDGGTSLGQGIFTSLNAIVGEPIAIDESLLEEGSDEIPPDAVQIDYLSSAVIVLLSDGENTGPPNPLSIAQIASEGGVRIYPVGIGSTSGAILEIDGFSIITQLNEPLLQEIASLTNGTYYYAEDAEELREIYQNIDLQLTVKGEQMEVTALVAAVSFLCFLLGGGLSMYWLGRVP